MIIARLISGLGNQLFQYAVARQLSIKNKVDLKLDLSFFETQTLRSFKLNKFNIKADIATEKELQNFLWLYRSNHPLARGLRRVNRIFGKNKRLYFKERVWWEYEPELLNSGGNLYLDGYWQHHRYFEMMDDLIFQELTVRNDEATSISHLNSEISKNHSSVSLHIRRGDYLKDTLMNVLPAGYYHNAIKSIHQKIKDPTFYIFSDDLEWARDNIQVKFPVSYIDINEGKTDYLELELMSKCRHNIIANSSFSWWGAFLNKNPDKIVIAPQNWVVSGDVNPRIHLQFPSWIKL